MQCRCFAFGNMHVITAYPLSSFGCFSCSKCQTGPLLNPFCSQWVSFFIIFYVPYLRWFISTCNIKTKIKKTDNCARACHLHQGATRRAAVDFRTNITCQCHYLNLLLCQSISWSLALHQPLYPPQRGGCCCALPSLLGHVVINGGSECLAEKNGRSSGTAHGSGVDLKGGVLLGTSQAGPLQSWAASVTAYNRKIRRCCVLRCSVLLYRKPQLLPAGIGLARTALQEQPSKLERPDCNGGNESTRGKKTNKNTLHFYLSLWGPGTVARQQKRPQSSHECTPALNYCIRNIYWPLKVCFIFHMTFLQLNNFDPVFLL